MGYDQRSSPGDRGGVRDPERRTRERPRPAAAPLLLPVLVVLTPASGLSQTGPPLPYELRTEVYSVGPTRNGVMALMVDLYRPVDRPLKGAVILMHGGGFATGHRELEENRAYGKALAGRGYLGAAISYRLYKDEPVVDGWAVAYSRMAGRVEHPRWAEALRQLGPRFPDAVAAAGVDLLAAVDFLRRRAPELGFDVRDIAVFGASAGAITALTTVYAMELYEAEAVDVAAVIDLRGLLLPLEPEVNPFEEGDPPLLILHGEADDRVTLPYAEYLFALAKEAGTPVELYTVDGVGHELGGTGLLSLRVDRDRTVLDRMDEFLEEAFAGETLRPRSLRGRLLPANDAAEEPGRSPGPEAGAGDGLRHPAPAGGDSLFKAELARTTLSLVESVQRESGFVSSLYGISKPELLEHDFADRARRDWSYWPRRRGGLPIRHMSAEQRTLTQRILSTLLSAKGYLQVNHIMMLEEILAGGETIGFDRGAEEYGLTVFGHPSPTGVWGLRFEGHHLSLNVTLTPNDIFVTPSFLGAAPAPVTAGARAGFNPLVYEQRHALALLASLNEWQRAAAILAREPPAEVLTSQFQVDSTEWDDWQGRLGRDGVSASTLDREQASLLRALLAEVVGTYRPEIGRTWLDTLDLSGLAFAWMGGEDLGRPHYFRIQGRDFVFELDAAQDDGSHVHAVWRDRRRDFGGDFLREHYLEGRH